MPLVETTVSFFSRILNGTRMSIIDYLKTEIKPEILLMKEQHQDLSQKVAALPTRQELDHKLDIIHKRIDTKMDKNPIGGNHGKHP